MIAALIALASAGPVRCDPEAAASLLTEARIAEDRAPVSHPELVPGLALASPNTAPDLSALLTELCTGDSPDLSLVVSDVWREGDWSAHTFLLTRAEAVGCSLHTRTAALTVGVREDGIRYALRDARERTASTPMVGCDDLPEWTEEKIVGGAQTPERLVLVTEHKGDDIVGTRVLARRALPDGWTDQVILEPAPPRLLDPQADGPRVMMTETGERWIVETHERTTGADGCRPIQGQRLWHPTADGWVEASGGEALGMLASRGLWRYAGEDGWIAVVAQDDEEDEALVAARARRLGRRNRHDLTLLKSSAFPELNPGFSIAVLGPFGTEEEAKASLKRYRGGGRRYVKRAWTAVDGCAED
ncbi:MAG: hypothetical protein EP330_12670 [Deltaproteobacteria bacterium]|nr:MAG: hypothetical protein EP330_12670 [Deltaproteobacteria bacterium]